MNTPIFIFLLMLSSLSWAQTGSEERLKRYQDFHQKLREQMLKGFDDKSLEEMNRMVDSMMDEALRDFPTSGLSRFSSGPTLSWSEKKEGRELLVIPKSKNDKLDIQVQNQMITIKTVTSGENLHAETSNMQNVPSDCEGDQVKMQSKEGGVVLFFPWKKSAKPAAKSLEPERKPLKPQKSEFDV